jgi:8-amino-7-oxononanoate synthase
MVSGSHRAHELAEAAVARWLGFDCSLLYASGYAANLGLISALAGPGDLVVSDALNHASIIDGCRLSRATVAVIPHGDLDACANALRVKARRRFVVVESLFSMEGDSPDLARLRAICDEHEAAFIVDEAHALGAVGPEGAGLCAGAGVRPDALVGTFGKALGLQGAFVAGSVRLREWLWNRSRSFVFSTGTSPALAAAVEARVARVRRDDDGRLRLQSCAAALRKALPRAGGWGHVIPWILGSAESALHASALLRVRGVLVRAIRPPTVPGGTARLRITASAGLSEDEVGLAVRALGQMAECFT